jgi:dTDP-4-dehydrorhamnose reductase
MTHVQAQRVLIVGATGMLGHTLLKLLSSRPQLMVFGTIRNRADLEIMPRALRSRIVPDVDASELGSVQEAIVECQASIVVNCVGVIKQRDESADPLVAIPINSVFPHQLARLCREAGARLVHVSTDCVFSGRKGGYSETDEPDAQDLYGRSKLLGEVHDPPSVTLRTSIIGHELRNGLGLLEWFLSQKETVAGFRRAIFSGLPAIELSRVIADFVLPNPALTGLYHLSTTPISKYDMLHLIRTEYGRQIEIRPDDTVAIDRSLDSTRFKTATGFVPPDWVALVRAMHRFG